jgi:hypothetical protein
MTPHVVGKLTFAQMVQCSRAYFGKITSFAQMTQRFSWLDECMEPHNTSLSCTQHVIIVEEPTRAKDLPYAHPYLSSSYM